ncbi:unnamed protein product [Effrenium voratum]|uniref:AAA+ ATPase domain-containing protein n=1 Tax=Effrenium voratum TaxID=2562239 RepID=A0AA36IW42_9DINO|nr:unnamed protein product [Effrenium voratum]
MGRRRSQPLEDASAARRGSPASPTARRTSPRCASTARGAIPEGDQSFSRISRARMAMSPAVLGTMPCREQQQSELFNHLSAAIRQGGSKKVLYISGMPGTGKTASVLQVEAQLKQKFAFVHINAMCLGKPSAVFGEVWRQLREAGLAQERCSAAAAEKQVEGFFLHRATQQVVVLLIDELDCLATRNQAILYRILSLIMLPKPHLVMVAISNNIDLPERLLPKVSTRLGFDRVDFRTYTRDQIHEILRKRLEVYKALDTFTNDTLKYCAARVAGHSGDVRKALQLCKRALDVCRQLPVTIQDLRAADQDLLQANPCVKAVHGLSALDEATDRDKIFELRARCLPQATERDTSFGRRARCLPQATVREKTFGPRARCLPQATDRDAIFGRRARCLSQATDRRRARVAAGHGPGQGACTSRVCVSQATDRDTIFALRARCLPQATDRDKTIGPRARCRPQGTERGKMAFCCATKRQHLTQSVEERLRPKQRDAQGRVLAATDEEHAQEWQLVVYTRFDSEDIRPEEAAVMLVEAQQDPRTRRELRMFNHVSNIGVGVHYDALLPRDVLQGLPNMCSLEEMQPDSELDAGAVAGLEAAAGSRQTAEASVPGCEPECAGGDCGVAAPQQPPEANATSDFAGADMDAASDDGGSSASEVSSAGVELLAAQMRSNPTLPSSGTVSAQDMMSEFIRLPLFSCPFAGCVFETDDEGVFLQHVEGAEGPHAKAVAAVSAQYVSPMCHGDMVAAAVALLERRKVPCVGAAVTRRVLRRLAEAACDAEVQALVCFVCGQVHTTARGAQETPIAMALANDHFYGYVPRMLLSEEVTWLEVAAASTIWTSMLVYYLEAPFGHLQLEHMRGEEELARLVHVHIVGHDADVVDNLRGATMRVDVVLALINYLRSAGFPGYESADNGAEAVAARMEEVYGRRYGNGPFVPQAVREATQAARRERLQGASLIEDKVAAPAENATDIDAMCAAMRPLTFVAENSGPGSTSAHREHAQVLGYRLEDAREQWEPARVSLLDLVKGLPRRIEAQFRQHWAFVPGLWNLYFRDRLNRQVSLRFSATASSGVIPAGAETSAAQAAADLYDMLQHGHFRTASGTRQRIAGDVAKLRFAERATSQQRQLLADYRFRTQQLPGTQEIRSRIGRSGFWTSVVYGNGIFMTVTPGERQNYLAVRLSRLRQSDPHASGVAQWVGHDCPSLEAQADDVFEAQVPGYDARKLLLARDPLGAALAFGVQIRVILANILGVRMCASCPDCGTSEDKACMDRFGSCATYMGGVAGRCDGLCGAVECQKSTGALHYHFWAYVQRAHQLHTLQEITAMLRSQLLSVSSLKHFYETVCQTEFPQEVTAWQQARVEGAWPEFHECPAGAAEPARWGQTRPGRIPPFVWADAAAPKAAGPSQGHTATKQELLAEAKSYEESYRAALQVQLEWSQLHIHRMDRASGQRKVPGACRRNATETACKHGFPKDAYMNAVRPLVVCGGIARRARLPRSCRRSMVGRVLPRRNSPWLNGTAPGLALGMSGANTDVKLNDLIPVLEETHENEICGRACAAKAGRQGIKKLVRRFARAQSVTNGYFGGYISKRQKLGKLELRKCVRKLLQLQSKLQARTSSQQFRAVSGRMISDLEINGTVRGAVESMHLCINARDHDALSAECIRSFPTISVRSQAWFERLHAELRTCNVQRLECTVPLPSRKVSAVSQRTIPWVDAYGMRPQTQEFELLSPFEFLRYWTVEAVEVPKRGTRAATSRLTDLGREVLASASGATGPLLPGVHFHVREPGEGDAWITFPESKSASTERFRHMWILRRRARPHVPVLEGCRLPSLSNSAEYNAKLFSVFFRPWTLRPPGTATVPLLRNLGRVDPVSELLRDMAEPVVRFSGAWETYLRDGVASEHGLRLIKTVLQMSLCGGAREEDEGPEQGVQNKAPQQHPRLAAEDVARALRGAEAEAGLGQVRQGRHGASLKRVSDVFGTAQLPAQSAELAAGSVAEDACVRHLHALSQPSAQAEPEIGPYAEERAACAFAYPPGCEVPLRKWLADIQLRPLRPTPSNLAKA